MRGIVVALRRNGVIIEMETNEQLEAGDLFQIYRVENNVETIIGTGYIRKPKGDRMWKINSINEENGARGGPFVDAKEGDLVRKVP